MPRRRSRAKVKKKSSYSLKSIPLSIKVLTVSVLSVVFILLFGYTYIRFYISKDSFRDEIGEVVGKFLGGNGSLESLSWEGWNTHSSSFTLEQGAGILKKVEARGIKTKLRVSSYNEDAWHIPHVEIENLKAQVSKADDSYVAYKPEKPTGIKALFPNSAKLQSFEIKKLHSEITTVTGDLYKLNGMRVVGEVISEGNLTAEILDGEIDFPWQELNSAKHHGSSFNLKDEVVQVEDAHLTIYGDKTLTADLKLDFKNEFYQISGKAEEIELERFIPADWQKSIDGQFTLDFIHTEKPKVNSAITTGQVTVKNGVIEALPLLDTIAAYTNNSGYRRLDIDKFTCRYRLEKGATKLSNIDFASKGKVRVKGDLAISAARELQGKLRIGIPAGTLSFIPGAETKVFLPGEAGMMWASVHIGGTVEAPTENLSNQLLTAAAERIPETIIESIKNFSPLTGIKNQGAVQNNPAKTSEAILKTGTDVLSSLLGKTGSSSDTKKVILYEQELSIPNGLEFQEQWREGASTPYAKVKKDGQEILRLYFTKKEGRIRDLVKEQEKVKSESHKQVLTDGDYAALISNTNRVVYGCIQIDTNEVLEIRLLAHHKVSSENLKKMKEKTEDIARSVKPKTESIIDTIPIPDAGKSPIKEGLDLIPLGF